MPVVNITLLPGYGPDCESRLVQRVALATRSVIAAQAAGTTVFVQHAATYMRDGRVFFDGTPRQLTDDVVRDIYGSEGLTEFNEAVTSTAAHPNRLRETA